MDDWKFVFERLEIIMSYQMVFHKERVINKRIPLTCCSCNGKINLDNEYFIYWIKPHENKEIGSFGENVCTSCDSKLS